MTTIRKVMVISSDPVKLELVEKFVEEIFYFFKIRRDLYNKVLVCLNEAVMNSISHGNRFEESKKVIIESYCCNKFLYFRIVDEGKGFDYASLKDPTELNCIFREGGRGIFIIKSISDGIVYRSKGNVVEFKIRTDGGN